MNHVYVRVRVWHCRWMDCHLVREQTIGGYMSVTESERLFDADPLADLLVHPTLGLGLRAQLSPKTCWLCPEKRSMVMAAAVFPCVTTAGLIWTSQLNDVGMDLVTSGPWQINGNGAACLLGGPFLILTLAGQVDNEVAWFNGSVVRKPAAKLWI